MFIHLLWIWIAAGVTAVTFSMIHNGKLMITRSKVWIRNGYPCFIIVTCFIIVILLIFVAGPIVLAYELVNVFKEDEQDPE